jgi:hypothetical protein
MAGCAAAQSTANTQEAACVRQRTVCALVDFYTAPMTIDGLSLAAVAKIHRRQHSFATLARMT